MSYHIRYTKDEETLNSVFERLTNSSSLDYDEIELEVSEDDALNSDLRESEQSEHAVLKKTDQVVKVAVAKFGSWLVLKNISLTIKALLIISTFATISIFFVYGLPNFTKNVSAECLPDFELVHQELLTVTQLW